MAARLLTLITFVTLILAGCAKSPQQVNLAPSVDPNARLSKSPVIQLDIVDNRPRKALGARGGIYATNYITLAQPLEESLRPELTQALQAMGAEFDKVTPFPVRLTVYLDRLSYEVAEKAMPPKTVTLTALARAKATRGEETYEGRWESSQKHQFLRTPSEEKNQEIINAVLSDTLSRMVNDPRLLQFLQR